LPESSNLQAEVPPGRTVALRMNGVKFTSLTGDSRQ
jgi:hypothetical protein